MSLAIDPHVLVEHVEKCLTSSTSKCTQKILEMEGMSGTRTRHLYNNLCSLDIGRPLEYLEVGTWKGSTIISAMYGNEHTTRATTVDNWADFEGPKDEFLRNIKEFGVSPTVVDLDCFQYTPSEKIDIFLYDGDHSYEVHKKAIEHFWPYLQDTAIIIIDDWNIPDVQRGTMHGFHSAAHDHGKCTVLLNWQLTTHFVTKEGFWNGTAIFVIQKQP